MTLPLSPEAEPALTPVRAWLLAAAQRDADDTLAEARAQVAQRLEEARAEAEELVSTARAEGAAQGAEAAARALARGRREARSAVLHAQATLQAELRDAARAAVLALRDDADYPALRDRLTRTARNALGPGAVVTEPATGGIVARDGSRAVDLSLPVLADQVLDALGVEVATLWT